jgi:hypothetical protein
MLIIICIYETTAVDLKIINQLKLNKMTITKTQLQKLNLKVSSKYADINVTFTLYGVLQAKYTDFSINSQDTYFYQLWNSLIANNKKFEDIYFSI